MTTLSLGAAFLAGALSFFSPCVLPMLPTFLLILAGTKAKQGTWHLLQNVCAFLLGFAMAFMALGAAATALGSFLLTHLALLEKLGGVLLILLGAFLSGLWKPLALYGDYRPFLQRKAEGPVGCFLMGMSFTFGWTPCTGPILAAILLYAGSRDTVTEGMGLLLVYTLGFALPFLALTLLWKRLADKIRGLYRYLPPIQKAAGFVLMALGAAMVLGWMMKLNGFLFSIGS